MEHYPYYNTTSHTVQINEVVLYLIQFNTINFNLPSEPVYFILYLDTSNMNSIYLAILPLTKGVLNDIENYSQLN